MSGEAAFSRQGSYSTAGRTYRESATYIASFLAFLHLHELRSGEATFPLEMVPSGLSEEDQQLLR